MSPELESSGIPNRRVVGVRILVVATLMFMSGVTSVLVIQGLTSDRQLALSIRELVPLVFTIALGAASVTLAAVALAMSRSAEDTLTRRSDEGIRLQTETYVRTNEVLCQIRASTGVTEKRIEDIIAGRTAIVAREVVARSLEKAGTPVSTADEEAISRALTEVLRSEVLPLLQAGPLEADRRLSGLEASQRERKEMRRRWNSFRLSVVEAFRRLPNVSVVSETRGELLASSAERFWDIVVELGGVRAGVDTRTVETLAASMGEDGVLGDAYRERFLSRYCVRGERDNLKAVFFVLDKDVWSEEQFRSLIGAIEGLQARSPGCRFVMLGGDPPEVATKMCEELAKYSSH